MIASTTNCWCCGVRRATPRRSSHWSADGSSDCGGTLGGLTGDEAAAWDVIQEAWIGISRGINRLADAAAFPAWAYQIVSNKCRDSVRRERRRREATETYSRVDAARRARGRDCRGAA